MALIIEVSDKLLKQGLHKSISLSAKQKQQQQPKLMKKMLLIFQECFPIGSEYPYVVSHSGQIALSICWTKKKKSNWTNRMRSKRNRISKTHQKFTWEIFIFYFLKKYLIQGVAKHCAYHFIGNSIWYQVSHLCDRVHYIWNFSWDLRGPIFSVFALATKA